MVKWESFNESLVTTAIKPLINLFAPSIRAPSD